MKVYGERILNSNMRFTFEVEGDKISTFVQRRIDELNELVQDGFGKIGTSLGDVVDYLAPLVDSEEEVRVRIEPAEFE